jgi:hypothetical protein
MKFLLTDVSKWQPIQDGLLSLYFGRKTFKKGKFDVIFGIFALF